MNGETMSEKEGLPSTQDWRNFVAVNRGHSGIRESQKEHVSSAYRRGRGRQAESIVPDR
jgi:hypothetical protein